MLSLKKLNLGQTEKQTFKIHLVYSIIEGVIAGILALNEFTFLKSLKGSNVQLSFLFQFSMIVFLFLIIFNEFIKRTKNKKQLLRVTAVVTRAPLLLLFFFPNSNQEVLANPIYHFIFLGIFLIYYLASPIIFPTINLFLKNSYRHENFGKLYGYATTINKIVLLITTFLYGILLDYNNFAFNFMLPVVAILGILSAYILSTIRYSSSEIAPEKSSFFESVRTSFRSMKIIQKNNKPYRDFEIGFMFYGFAMMSTVSIINIFFDKTLHLNYSSVAFYKNSYNIIAILLLPFFSRLIGKIDPRKFAIITFSSICLYLSCLALTEYFQYHTEILGVQIYYLLIVYVLFHSVFAATMSLLWSIGSAYFCKKSEADLYQATHLYLTGVRAIFAPIVGVIFYQYFGFAITIIIAVISLIIGIAYLYTSQKITGDLQRYE
ncbi:MAG: MFS transporter [Bacteroidota bacterium]